MKIKTTYDIGHVFWVPRVIKRTEKETITQNGNEYSRTIEFLFAEAKQKRVTNIKISVTNDGTKTDYGAVSVGSIFDDLVFVPRWYNEDDLQFKDMDSALNFARWWRENEQTEYYGSDFNGDL